jgi:ferrochelatase
VAEGAVVPEYDLVYQSRSGAPGQPWLEPDILDHLTAFARIRPMRSVVIVPIGFVSDHMEVVYDLDTEARTLCDELGLKMFRVATAGDDPRFVRMIRELVLERRGATDRVALGTLGPAPDVCAADCCPAPHLPKQ